MGSPQYGWIDIGAGELPRGEFLYRLTKAKAATREVTFIPGDTTYVVLEKIASVFHLDPQKLQSAYSELSPLEDGIIIADTYKLPLGFDEKEVVAYIVAYSMKQHQALALKHLGRYDQTEWFRLITIASIVEKEAASIAEMPLVASVIYNRLAKRMRLQMDGALNYGEYSNIRITSRRIREDRSEFNTYKRRGLPPHPVSIVSNAAILAALFPTKSNYLYFVKNNTGSHTFSESYNSHLRAIKSGK